MILFALVVWLLIIVFVGYAIDRLWVSMAPGRWYRYVVAPGEWVHQLSHVVGCFLGGAEVTGIQLYEPEGGRVSHNKPFIPILGNVLISLAPLVGCPLVLYLVAGATGMSIRPAEELTDRFVLTIESFGSIPFDCATLMREGLGAVTGALRQAGFSLRAAVFVYLAIVLTMRMAPSKADLKNSIHGIVFLAAAFIALAVAARLPTFRPWYDTVKGFVYAAWPSLSFGAALMMVILAASTVIAGLARLWKVSKPPESQ
jgi:hypothetical protein